MSDLKRTYRKPPPAIAYMLNALRPSPGWSSERGCPDLQMNWRNFRLEAEAAERLCRICGIQGAGASGVVDLLYPQVTGFRLVMAMLTHPVWPLPIWNALQIRNRLVLHAPLQRTEAFDLDVAASAWRVLAKGVEIDLRLRLTQAGSTSWESIVTFYYRGRYGDELQHGTALGAAPASPSLNGQHEPGQAGPGPGRAGGTDQQAVGDESAAWSVGDGDRWQFGHLTGDYNGLHQWNWYARRMRFPAAFPHPQRVLGQCLARLPEPEGIPLLLDLWIKGPVFFGRDVTLRHRPAPAPGVREFGLWLRDESRPSLLGRLGPMEAAGVLAAG